MGAFAAATGEIKFSALENALNHRFPKELAIKNIEAARQAYNAVKGGCIMALAVGCRARPGKGP